MASLLCPAAVPLKHSKTVLRLSQRCMNNSTQAFPWESPTWERFRWYVGVHYGRSYPLYRRGALRDQQGTVGRRPDGPVGVVQAGLTRWAWRLMGTAGNGLKLRNFTLPFLIVILIVIVISPITGLRLRVRLRLGLRGLIILAPH